jgi:hypothetical protein
MHKLTCLLAVLFLAVMAPMAHAGLEIVYSIDGGGPVTCGPVAGANPFVACANIVGPPLTINGLSADSNSPGDTPTEEDSATVKIVNPDAVNSHTIVINVISTDFTTPVTPPAIELLSHIGGSVAVGATANLLSFISCVDTTNSQTAGCPANFNAPTITPAITATGSFQGDSNSLIGSLGPAAYAIDEQITLTLGAKGSMNFSASTTLVQTPEPMSIVFLGSVVLVCSGLARRKRKGASQV